MLKDVVALLLALVLASVALERSEAQQASNQPAIRSPRLVKLEMDLKSRDVAALDNFWREVEQRGTPLVESIPSDEKHVLVTFLWRGGTETKNVGLFSDLPGMAEAPEVNLLTNLLGTDVWFKSYKVRKDGRFTYYLSPNDSLIPRAQRKDKDWETLQADPLNPHHFVMHEEERDWVRSLVELPGAAPVRWLEALNAPKGRIQMYHLSSKVLREDRRFWIYTPLGYTSEGKLYDLVVLFDGWMFAQMIPTGTIVDNLLAAGRIRPLVVLMVDQKDRSVELACNESFNAFLVHELIPWVRARYHVTSDPAKTTIGGQSFGGLAAAFAGLRHPEVFGNVLAITGDFSWDPREGRAADQEDLEYEWIIRQYAGSPKLPLRFAITAGLFDYGGGITPQPSSLAANRHMRDVLLAKGYTVIYREIAGADEVLTSAIALPDGLSSLSNKNGTNKMGADTRQK
jgi:enterochelin esterase-like enzyme